MNTLALEDLDEEDDGMLTEEEERDREFLAPLFRFGETDIVSEGYGRYTVYTHASFGSLQIDVLHTRYLIRRIEGYLTGRLKIELIRKVDQGTR